jgi:anaerobic nitric oxide reductase transcription regulator
VRELEHAIHRAVVLARATRSGDEVVIHARHFALHDETTQVVTQAPRDPMKTCVKRRKSFSVR